MCIICVSSTKRKAKEQAAFSRKYSETNPFKKLDWNVTDERILSEQVRHCLGAPLYTGGPGQTVPVARPPPVGGTDSKYLPPTIHLILCALQRIMRRTNRHPFNIFDKKDVRFRRFYGTMETTYQNLHKVGIRVEIKHASIRSEEEAILWEQQILGFHSPKALVKAVFFLNGKIFCLRGGKEHRELKLSQFQREHDHWKYTEYGSKNFRGGLADLRQENEVIRQFVPVLETVAM